MMKALSITLFSLVSSVSLFAGGINVLHVGPPDPLKFQVSAGDATQDFMLAHGASTGSFLLPNEPSTVKGFIENVPALEVPASDVPRIAVLAPSEEGFKWHLIPAKPTPDKWAFRIINLSPLPAKAVCSKKLVEIPVNGESAVEVTGKSQINLKIPNAINLSYEGSEPCAVVAFIYREKEEWKAILIPDR